MDADIPPNLYSLLINGHPANTDQAAILDQAIELIHALSPSKDAMGRLLTRLIRTKHTGRRLIAMRLIRTFPSTVPASVMALAEKLILDSLYGSRRPTTNRGLALLSELSMPQVTVKIWKHILTSYPQQPSYLRASVLEDLTRLVPADVVLPDTEIWHEVHLGRSISSEMPRVLRHMPYLEEIDFACCYNTFPTWIAQVSSLKRLDLRASVSSPLYSAMLPPRIESLALDSSETPQISLSIPSLKSLQLHRCRQLTQLNLQGCLSLESLDLYRCTSLTKLPAHLAELPALRSIDVSGCVQLQEIPDALYQCVGLRIETRGCRSLTASPS